MRKSHLKDINGIVKVKRGEREWGTVGNFITFRATIILIVQRVV